MICKANALLSSASELSEDGKFVEALKYYNKVLEIEPDNISAIINSGVTLQNLGHLSKATQMYEKALILDSKNFDALINMGSVLHTLERYAEASCFIKKLDFFSVAKDSGRFLSDSIMFVVTKPGHKADAPILLLIFFKL